MLERVVDNLIGTSRRAIRRRRETSVSTTREGLFGEGSCPPESEPGRVGVSAGMRVKAHLRSRRRAERVV